MKNFILVVFSVLSLTAVTAAVAWNDHVYSPAFRDGPGWYEGSRSMPGRRGYGSRFGVHIERGTYEGGYLLRVYTRGLRPQDIEVSAERGRIRLRSEMSGQSDWQDDYRRSRVSGYRAFTRSIPLPYDADAGKLEITAADALLEVRIPRR